MRYEFEFQVLALKDRCQVLNGEVGGYAEELAMADMPKEEEWQQAMRRAEEEKEGAA